MIRHGDLIIETSRMTPSGATIESNVLATGSATGHSHRYEPAEAARQYAVKEGRLLVAHERVTITHQEHVDVVLEPGTYLVSPKRQYDKDNGWQEVID